MALSDLDTLLGPLPASPEGQGSPGTPGAGHARPIHLPAIPQDLIDRCDVQAIARLYTPAALMALASIVADPDAPASARASASATLLDRGAGKAVATTVMANPDGTALFSGVEIVLVSPRHRVLEHRAVDDDGLAPVEPEP